MGSFSEVLNKLKRLHDFIATHDNVSLATSERFGAIASCPSNIGTGLRFSIHLQLPYLTDHGASFTRVQKICKDNGLQARGVNGEHTAMDSSGTCDISTLARFCITEAQS